MNKNISIEDAETIFKENSNFVYRVALFITKSKALADDITQETFIQVFRSYNTFDCSKPIQPWIYKIAVNVTRNMLRRQKWLKFIDKIPEVGYSDLVENTVLRNEEESELCEEINKLSTKTREVLVLHFYAGMKLTEVSDALGIPVGTCKSRLNAVLNSLRKQFPKNEFGFYGKGGDMYETI